MCDSDKEQLAEAVYAFDRLMTAQSRDRDVTDEVTCDVFEAKPDVDSDDDDDDANRRVELTPLPAPTAKDRDKCKHLHAA